MHLETAWDVYAWLLLEKGYGHPLWSPEPHEKGEVNIGSVGFIRQGRFYCLLNASKPSDADENRRWGDLGPFRFRPFHNHPTDQVDNPRPFSTHILHSSSIAKWKYWRGDMGDVGIYLQCEDDQAALLHGIKNYIRRNQDEWHRIAAEHTDTDIKQGDLIFVTGWIKTSDCSLTACTHEAWSGFVNLDDGSEEISVTVSGHNGVAPGWEQKISLHSRNDEVSKNNASGPDGSQSDSNTNDRCIFIQYYKTKRRKILASSLSKLKASAQSRNSDDKSKGDASHGHIPSTRDKDEQDSEFVVASSAKMRSLHRKKKHDTSSLRFRVLGERLIPWDLSRFARGPPQQKMQLYSDYYS
ncbi:hypothetical protein WOLCODRAFT_154584 [Wolfiporia cocos MD-104 SS10]|uniref:Uncharacterized protein n=1 Tax=Wolfiporia cocos (strain MD-104) TaxID=742152 RepID=A0A2H3JQX0_WOLCO|nr:hypothetical protein WOLCODRAFT_154584 [Wolfiporia cocos MD-104 SS10]